MPGARSAAVAFAALALAGCSALGEHKKASSAPPSFAQCVRDWNAADNGARQSLVARTFVPAGYTHAGVQMSLTTGIPGRPDPNPVGCRVVFFRHDRWVAYLARRDGDHFRFRARLRQSDQHGAWPRDAQRGPTNARIIGRGKLALSA
jgi:hypothetical protein